jgi:hypothetical protein
VLWGEFARFFECFHLFGFKYRYSDVNNPLSQLETLRFIVVVVAKNSFKRVFRDNNDNSISFVIVHNCCISASHSQLLCQVLSKETISRGFRLQRFAADNSWMTMELTSFSCLRGQWAINALSLRLHVLMRQIAYLRACSNASN